MEHIFKTLTKILSLKQQQASNYSYQLEGQPEYHLERFLLSFISKDSQKNKAEVITKFIIYMSEHRHCKLFPQFFNDMSGIKMMACAENKVYTFDPESRAYCIYGKAVSVMKRKTKQIQSQRSQLCTQIENTLFQLNSEGNLFLSKTQSRQIDDILMNFSFPEDTVDPVFLSREIFHQFVPQPFALVLVIPVCLPKQDNLMEFLKSSLLHIYLQHVNVLSKVIFRELFYKNSVIKGIYFIQEGQVQSKGGRIIARGWVTNGKCKAQGYGWKFKPLPFLKSLAKNEYVWKQFVNDLQLNKQYPFKISNILSLQSDDQTYEMPEKMSGRRALKLPRIGHTSFDYGKLTQIEKMKHYDDRINEICDFKQRLYLKKTGKSYSKNLGQLVGSYEEKANRKKMLRNQSTSKSSLKQPQILNASSGNILIMSVLKKLEGLTQPRTEIEYQYKQKRDKFKISPAKLYQKSRIMKKKRYNQ